MFSAGLVCTFSRISCNAAFSFHQNFFFGSLNYRLMQSMT